MIEKDSKEKILSDWNNRNSPRFDDYNNLYKYIKLSAKEQGKQNSKISEESVVSKESKQYVSKEFNKRFGVGLRYDTTSTLSFRKRIKLLGLGNKSID